MQQGLDFEKRQTIMEVISLRDRGRFIVVVLSFAISIPSLSLLEPTNRTVWSSNSRSFYDSHWKQNANEDATNIAKVSSFRIMLCAQLPTIVLKHSELVHDMKNLENIQYEMIHSTFTLKSIHISQFIWVIKFLHNSINCLLWRLPLYVFFFLLRLIYI